MGSLPGDDGAQRADARAERTALSRSIACGARNCTQATANSAETRFEATENGMKAVGTGPRVRWNRTTATGMKGHQRQPCTISAPMAMPAGGQISVT